MHQMYPSAHMYGGGVYGGVAMATPNVICKYFPKCIKGTLCEFFHPKASNRGRQCKCPFVLTYFFSPTFLYPHTPPLTRFAIMVLLAILSIAPLCTFHLRLPLLPSPLPCLILQSLNGPLRKWPRPPRMKTTLSKTHLLLATRQYML